MKSNSLLYFLLGLTIILLLTECRKNEIIITEPDPTIPITSMDQINVDHDFNWSSSNSGNLTVIMKSDIEIATEGEVVLLIDKDQNIISKGITKDQKVYFNIKTPVENDQLSLFYPNTGLTKKLSNLDGVIDFYIETPPRDTVLVNASRYALDLKDKYAFFKPSELSSKGINKVLNPYFDINNLCRNNKNYNKLRTPGKWYYRDGNNIGTSVVNGNNVFKNTQNSDQELVQSFVAAATTEYNIKMYYSGSISLYMDEFNLSENWLKDNYIATPTSNNNLSVNIITSSSCHYLQLFISISKNSYIDSVVVEEVPSIVDTDGDGIADNQDDFPNDSTKVYRVMYPTTGYQTLSFEDLWPSKGDYDFNDIIISAKTEFATNANGDYVWANCQVSLDACGSSLPSGLAVHFLKPNKTAYTTQMITSVSGHASIETGINNCIIIYTDHFSEQTIYYTNTGNGHNATPELFNFVVNLASTKTLTPTTFIPDFFYFRTDARSHEIHMTNFPPTSKANTLLFGTYDDDINYPYSTENGAPWGLEVVTANKTFKHPKEKHPIVAAYSQFGQWANSKGNSYKTWHNYWNNAEVFTWSDN